MNDRLYPTIGESRSPHQPAAPAHVVSDRVNTSVRDRGGSNYVRCVQRALNDRLKLRLRITGYLDVPSRSALRNYQRRLGLPATGRLGPATRRALAGRIPLSADADAEIDQFLGGLACSQERRAGREHGRARRPLLPACRRGVESSPVFGCSTRRMGRRRGWA